jgi:hypothetical protein
MPVNRLSISLICVCIALPVFLFGLAWRRNYQDSSRTLLLPTFSALLLLSTLFGNLKLWLLGSDYGHRLYVTIEVNMLLAMVAAIYFGMKKRWIAALAALLLALDWLYMASVNSVV